MLSNGHVIVDRFRIVEHAASGGMGSVYKALDEQSGEFVALKISRGKGGDQQQRLARESKVLAERLSPASHPGIVKYIDHGQLQTGEPYLAMEWLDGPNLSQRLTKSLLSPAETIELGIHLANALAAAHTLGVVHRDIKPGNLILADGRIDKLTLVDFGLVRLDASVGDLTRSGMMLGTPNFIAPEQARGDNDVGPEADLYSLGAVLFACLTGRPPFIGEHVMAVLAKLLLEPAPRARMLRPDTPRSLDRLIDRLMTKNPAERMKSAEAVIEALRIVKVAEEVDVESRPAIRVSTAEQRFVSLVLVGQGISADVRGSQSQLERLAESHHAAMERLADGTRLAVLTSGREPAEAAMRAARLALKLHMSAPQTPIVVATGRTTKSESGPVGEVIDRAVGLLLGDDETPQAEPSFALTLCDIMVCDSTARLLEQRFRLMPSGGHGYVLLSEKAHPSASRTLLGKPTRIMGRERECATLEAIFDECVEDEMSRVALVIGSAGSGKSTVARELVRKLRERKEPVAVWIAFADSMRTGSALGLLAQLIRRALSLTQSEPPDVQQAWLRDEITQRLPADDAGLVTVFLGEILGLEFADTGHIQLQEARANARLMHDQMRRAWEDWLHAECSRRPVLCILEDIHWADRPTIHFINSALRNLADLPLMVLGLSRPEVYDRFPSIFSTREPEIIRLRPLSQHACLTIAQDVLIGSSAAQTAMHLAERCEGNPFFLEELLRSAVSGDMNDLPATVLATVAARLESLPQEQSQVLRAASVFGRRFWLAGVAALLGDSADEVAPIIDQLIERELINALPTSRLPEQVEYSFRHELTRDAAYAKLVDNDRVGAHASAGEWLEQAGETEPIILAEHYSRGQAIPNALPWYHRAAIGALEANDPSGALDNIENAIACGAKGQTLGSLHLLQAEIHNWNGEHEKANHYANDALSLLPGESDDWADAAHHVVWACGSLAAYDSLIAISEQIIANVRVHAGGWKHLTALMWCVAHLFDGGRTLEARRLREFVQEATSNRPLPDSVAATLADADAFLAGRSGRPDRAAELFMKASQHWQTVGNQRNACLSRSNAGDDLLKLGQYESVERSQSELLAISQRLGADYLIGDIKHNLARAFIHLGKAPEAETILREIMTGAIPPVLRPFLAASLSQALLVQARYSAAMQEASDALSNATGHPRSAILLLALQARALLALGDNEQALATTSRGMEIIDPTDAVLRGDISLRLVHAEALYACARHDEAKSALDTAVTRLLALARTIENPAWKQSFLGNVPENHRTLQLAQAWLGQ